MKIIGIVGSRRRNTPQDYLVVEQKFFELYEKGDWICSGGCPEGADHFAEEIAKHYGIPILTFYPNTKELGIGGYFARNTKIAEMSIELIACVAEDRTGGTEDTIHKFECGHQESPPRGLHLV